MIYSVNANLLLTGVAYRKSLLDADSCSLDALPIQALGANTIRVYGVNSTQNIDGCMTAFAARGIYVLLDLDNNNSLISSVRSVQSTDISHSKPSATDKSGMEYRAIHKLHKRSRCLPEL